MSAQRYFPPTGPTKGKTLEQLTDQEVLTLAGPHGPGMIGQELFDRAEQVRTSTVDGKYGPALTDPDYGLDITPWDDYSRKELLAEVRHHELPNIKSNATRDELAKALVRAKKSPDVGEGPEA